MKLLILVCSLAVIASPLLAADHAWQQGVLRDLQTGSTAGVSVSVPIGGSPPTTVAGVTIPGTAPTYFSFPSVSPWQAITIDGPDGLTYVATAVPPGFVGFGPSLVVNDPITFAIDGPALYVRAHRIRDEADVHPKDHEYRFHIVKRIRQPLAR